MKLRAGGYATCKDSLLRTGHSCSRSRRGVERVKLLVMETQGGRPADVTDNSSGKEASQVRIYFKCLSFQPGRVVFTQCWMKNCSRTWKQSLGCVNALANHMEQADTFFFSQPVAVVLLLHWWWIQVLEEGWAFLLQIIHHCLCKQKESTSKIRIIVMSMFANIWTDWLADSLMGLLC